MPKKHSVITIDGPASSGKSSLARRLSAELHCPWLSTGAFYRGAAFAGGLCGLSGKSGEYVKLIRSGLWEVRMSAEKTLFFYKGQDRTEELYQSSVDDAASRLSQDPAFRKALLPFQRKALENSSLIAEGRDCGTVVFPQAALKIFLSAGSAVRAARRARDRGAEKGSIIQGQRIRDFRDKTRRAAPLVRPEGSLLIDTERMSLEEAAQKILPLARKALFE